MTRHKYVIVGGGMTGDAAAQGIREVDSSGAILLVSSETHNPYNRPPLSKGLWKGESEESIWRPIPKGTEVLLDRRIVTLDAKRRLTVPTGLAPASPGDYFDASFDAEEDALVFRRLPGKENWLTVLKACPVSPDDVPRRRRASARRRRL